MSRVIYVDPEVKCLLVHVQAALMKATGHYVSMSKAVAFTYALKLGR